MTEGALQGQPSQQQGVGTESGQGQPSPVAPVPNQGQQQGDGGYNLAGEFLGNIPDNVRPLIEPYVKQWDAQVTKKFQELHSQYEPYKNLGDVEQIQQAMAIAQALDENPQVIFDILREEIEGPDNGAGAFGQQPSTGAGQPPAQPPVGGLPPEFIERLDRSENLIAQMGEILLQERQMREEQSEDEEFENYLGGLKQQYGDFDEDWVTLQISRGMDGEEAVEAWQKRVQDIINSQGGDGGNVPPMLSGGGVGHESLNVKDISRNDLKSLVAGMLKQTNQQGG